MEEDRRVTADEVATTHGIEAAFRITRGLGYKLHTPIDNNEGN